MKSLKDTKKPVYSINLGRGKFVAATYIFQCKKCGLAVQKSVRIPPIGSCPAGGNHSWVCTQC